MGALLRFLIFVLLIYLVLRWLRSWWHEDKPTSRQKPPPPRPYSDKDVLDAKFTELPPDPSKSTEGDEHQPEAGRNLN